ncbi:hypothetical protein GEMRC1_006319 [Eukaryota sp. GEM-RC1]
MSSLVDVSHTGVDFDVALRSAFDYHPVEITDVPSRARDITQMLINKLFSLPACINQEDVGKIVDLPKPTHPLPRAKPIPTPKPPTKWEEFSKKKGIMKHKRDRMIVDEVTQELRPRFGYKRAGTLNEVPFVEAKPTDLPGSDPFTEAETGKKERVKKNLKNKMNNEQRNLTAGDKRRIALGSSIKLTSIATASMGKFNKTKKGEPQYKRKNNGETAEANTVSLEEKQRDKKVLGRILSKKPAVDKERAGNLHTEKTNRSKRRS